jgi:hypothetical protein
VDLACDERAKEFLRTSRVESVLVNREKQIPCHPDFVGMAAE